MHRLHISLIIVAWVLLLSPPSLHAVMLGAVDKVETKEHAVTFQCGDSKVLLDAWSDGVIRVWLSVDGQFNYYNDYNSYLIKPGMKAFSGPKAFDVTDTATAMEIRTNELLVEVRKSPFRVLFRRRSDGGIIACNPLDKSLDTDFKAFFQRDASGGVEHFFGLQVQGESTLDQRDKVRVTKDANGHGWVAPFFMSTAGYGIFFHNEYGWENEFSFADPVVFRNTNRDAQLDFFFIYGPDFPVILDRYTRITGRPFMPPRKLLGFNYLVQGTPINNEEAFPEWVSRGYPIDGCITFTDKGVITDEDKAAAAGTAQRIHKLNGWFGFYFDLAPCPGTFKDINPEDRTYPYDDWALFKKTLRERLLDNGVDWFWVDETDDYGQTATLDERGRFHLYRAMTETMESFDLRRGFLCGRGGYAGCQQFGYPWMGDIPYDKPCMIANVNNGLIGVAHSTHDMAGASVAQLSETAFLQGVKANLLNPITQCNAWVPNQRPCHKPWEWSENVQRIFRKFLDLHYRLIPYFYATAWQAHETGLPDWRALLLHYPNDLRTYDSDECLIGDWLLMAPLYTTLSRDVYLPAGEWVYYFSGKRFTGPVELKDFAVPESEYPLFVKTGAIIPMMPAMRYVGEKPVDPLELDIYPGGTSHYVNYEDDGVTRKFEDGDYCTTAYECSTKPGSVVFGIGERKGSYRLAPRCHVLKFVLSEPPAEVKLEGVPLVKLESFEALNAAASGWGIFDDDVTGYRRVFVRFPDSGRNTTIEVSL